MQIEQSGSFRHDEPWSLLKIVVFKKHSFNGTIIRCNDRAWAFQNGTIVWRMFHLQYAILYTAKACYVQYCAK